MRSRDIEAGMMLKCRKNRRFVEGKVFGIYSSFIVLKTKEGEYIAISFDGLKSAIRIYEDCNET